MSEDSILLDFQPHTGAKHQILDHYLKGWFPIMSRIVARSGRKIIYLDGFAGPGEYRDGSIGSPIIALEIAKNHILNLPSEIIFYFIEKDRKKLSHLKRLIDNKYSHISNGNYEKLPKNFKVYTNRGEFNSEMNSVLDDIDQSEGNLAPTFAFIDPFGWSEINVDILSRILKFKMCELLITYMVGFLDRFSFNEAHKDSIKSLFKLQDEQIAKITAISNNELREKEWLKLLIDNLTNYSNLKLYHLNFKITDRTNRTLYYLVYLTKSVDGIRTMKDAMWKVGRKGQYLFADFDFSTGQASILDYFNEIWIQQAADKVKAKFDGKKVSLSQIKKFVLIDTRFIWRKRILKNLEERDLIKVIRPKKRRKGTFPEFSIIEF